MRHCEHAKQLERCLHDQTVNFSDKTAIAGQLGREICLVMQLYEKIGQVDRTRQATYDLYRLHY